MGIPKSWGTAVANVKVNVAGKKAVTCELISDWN